ncbi:Hint domain-containing protein [Pseudovibrio sp. JE062]|uniref:Hint domain-containing protein n=1 Tax=Pseudovibrio sp. JE062 TaxID=439495 RepID=UPI000186C5E8|nr:Hint domain-containing protein [Pseudovibrio sp. JE062]EEA96794.1 conserved hypothetical protein [Pseudovibrio sp. JE062]
MTSNGKYTIGVAELSLELPVLPLSLPASHIVILAKDPFGNTLWQLNGMSTDTQGKPAPVGYPWDVNDTIQGFFGTNPFDGEVFLDESKMSNYTPIVFGDYDEIKVNGTFYELFEDVTQSINEQGLAYELLDQNSNSFAGTVLRALGISPSVWFLNKDLNFTRPVPGFSKDLLPENPSKKNCFLSGTPILLADRCDKPIEEIVVGDEIQSYNASGELVAGRVSKIFRKQSKHILDVFGLMITPGHVTYCGDGQFAGQHVPIIDILRTDGALVQADGSMIRATTGYNVGSEEDLFVWAVTGTSQSENTINIEDKKQIRVGSRFILDDGRDVCVLDLIKAAGGTLTEDGYIQTSASSEQLPFLWIFSNELPAPEDYILQRSQVSLTEIYEVGEWDGKCSRLTGSDIQSPRTIFTRSEDEVKRGKPNIPLCLQDKPQ